MSELDNTRIPKVWNGAAAITIEGDGPNESVSFTYVGAFSWTELGRSVSEARVRDRHQVGKPVVVETNDNDVSVSLSGLITSYLGDSDVHPYEAITGTGNAAGWTSTVDGGAYATRIIYTSLEPDSGAEQNGTFAYCHADSVKVDPKGEDSKASMDVEITDYENRPTWA